MSHVVPTAIRTASAQNLTRIARQEAAQRDRIHIQLRKIPRTAVPADIRRLVEREKLKDVANVAIDYHRFRPTGKAYITLTRSVFLRPNIAMLQRATLSAMPVVAVAAPPPATGQPTRSRGAKGRAEAAHRGLILGNGPNGGILNPERNVVMWGLPGKLYPDRLKDWLQKSRVDDDQLEIVKLEAEISFSLPSRFLVRLSSVSESHRLVRAMHMTYFEPERWGNKYLVRARVVY